LICHCQGKKNPQQTAGPEIKVNQKIGFLKRIDSVIGVPLIFLSRLFPISGQNADVVRSVLFIRPGGIGDAVLLLPAISLLKTKFPDSGIDVLCEKRNAGIFGLSGAIRRIYLYDRQTELIGCIRNNYDVVIDTEQWHRLSAVAAYFTKAPIRIGFGTNERGKLFTHNIPYSHDDYEVNSFLKLIEPLTAGSAEFSPEVPFIDIEGGDSLPFLEGFSEKDDALVAIFPGASVPERRWGGDKFGKVAEGLIRRGYKVVVVGSAGDGREAAEIRKYAPAAIDLTGKTSLAEVAALLKRCRLLITADSGLMHIACAVGTPTVSLFGSGIEKKWAPQGGRHIIINKRLKCSPCTKFGYTPGCEKGVECLSLISPDEVICAVEKLLTEGPH